MVEATVRVILPADSRFIATSRMTAVSLAAELDFSIDTIDELRTGANELVAMLVERAEDLGASRIGFDYNLTGDAIEITGTVLDVEPDPDGSGEEGLDQLTDQILSATVDDHEIGRAHGRILKRRAE